MGRNSVGIAKIDLLARNDVHPSEAPSETPFERVRRKFEPKTMERSISISIWSVLDSIFHDFLRVRRQMSYVWPGCFKGNDPMEVLVSYTLHVFHVLEGVSYATRIRIRYSFNLFARKMICPDQYSRIVAEFGSPARSAAEKLIAACVYPERLCNQQISRAWSVDETMLLLAGMNWTRNLKVEFLLQRRPVDDSWFARIRRVISDLGAHKMLSDELDTRDCRFGKANFTIVSQEPERRCIHKHRKTGMRKRGVRHITLVRTVKTLRKKMQTEKARQTKKLLSMQNRLLAEETCDELEDGDPCTGNRDHSIKILNECRDLLGVSKYGRRYSEFLYELAELLRATSRKTYRILRQLLPLPSETALYSRYGEAKRLKKRELTDLTLLEDKIQKLLSNPKVRKAPVTLAIDAFSFRTFTGRTIAGEQSSEEYSNAFLFLHIPLDFSLPVEVLHLQKKTTGSYDACVQSLFEKIKLLYAKYETPIWFKSTDGDRYLSREHDSFFCRARARTPKRLQLFVTRSFPKNFGRMHHADPRSSSFWQKYPRYDFGSQYSPC